MFQQLDEIYELPEYKQLFGKEELEIYEKKCEFAVEWKYNWDFALFVEFGSNHMDSSHTPCKDNTIKKCVIDRFKTIRNVKVSYCSSPPNESWHEIYVNVTRKILCELKPSLGDDYPDVLRKMRKQIEVTEAYFLSNDKGCDSQERHKASGTHYCIYVLIIGGEFNAESATKEQLIEIFKTAKIQVIFMSDLLDVNLERKICDEVKPKVQSTQELLQEIALLKNQLQIAQDKIKTLEEEKLLNQEIISDQTSSENKVMISNPMDIRSFFGGSKPK